MTWRRDERGSAALETAVGVPAFVLLVGLIILGGRTATTHQALQAAAADAARSASLERSAAEAKAAAHAAATASLANQEIDCLTVAVKVDASGFGTGIGTDASVDVTVTCRINLADLGLPGVPGSRELRATMTSPLDTWRERA